MIEIVTGLLSLPVIYVGYRIWKRIKPLRVPACVPAPDLPPYHSREEFLRDVYDVTLPLETILERYRQGGATKKEIRQAKKEIKKARKETKKDSGILSAWSSTGEHLGDMSLKDLEVRVHELDPGIMVIPPELPFGGIPIEENKWTADKEPALYAPGSWVRDNETNELYEIIDDEAPTKLARGCDPTYNLRCEHYWPVMGSYKGHNHTRRTEDAIHPAFPMEGETWKKLRCENHKNIRMGKHKYKAGEIWVAEEQAANCGCLKPVNFGKGNRKKRKKNELETLAIAHSEIDGEHRFAVQLGEECLSVNVPGVSLQKLLRARKDGDSIILEHSKDGKKWVQFWRVR